METVWASPRLIPNQSLAPLRRRWADRSAPEKKRRVFIGDQTTWICVFLVCLFLAGCGGGTASQGTAPVTLNLGMASARAASSASATSLWASLWSWLPGVTVASAQSVSDIATIRVEVSAADMALQSVTIPVSNPVSGQTVTVELNVSAGSGRTIYVSAYNATGTKLFSGTASGVNLTAGVPVAIPITLAPTITVTVQKTGTGTGTVTSAPAGIDCGATCSAQFDSGAAVMLTASATTGSFFVGWSGGGCAGTGSCSVSGPVTVTARFDLVTGVGIAFPPEVVARTPDNGTTSILTNAIVQAAFNTDMDAASITASTVTMTDQYGFTVQGSVSYDAGTKTLTFNPGGLGASTIYTMKLTTAIKDQTGVALFSDVVWSFTTAAQLLPFVTGLTAPQGLGVDDSFLYITDRGTTPGTGLVWRVLKNGSGAPDIVASNLNSPSAFASDSTSIYLVENGNALTKISKSNGTVTPLVCCGFGVAPAVGGTIDDTFVYFVESNTPTGPGQISKISLAGGSVTVLAFTGLSSPLGGGPVVDSTSLYFAESGTGKIRKVPLSGGFPIDLAVGVSNPGPKLSADSTFVYFLEGGFGFIPGSGTVKKVPLAGGSVTTLATGLHFASGSFGAYLDNGYIYFNESLSIGSGGGTVKKVSVNGGPVITLASGLDVPNRIAIDGTHVYFSEFSSGASGTGTIKKVPK